MVSTVIRNWDNKNWLSSKEYIRSFNNFLIKNIKLSSRSKILDIGCGRGKILGDLSKKLRLKNKPIGIDLVNHKDKDKRIYFKKKDAINFFLLNNKKFDLIIIKQTIHLLKIEQIKRLLFLSKKSLSPNGKILILSLDDIKNEIPSFKKMDIRLTKSLKRDKKILDLIKKKYPQVVVKRFIFKVQILKKEYLKMIQKRYMSILLKFSNKEILIGKNEINLKYKQVMKFDDRLICFIL